MAAGAETVHATCVAIGDSGVLFRGPSGSGKSDLALRLIYTVPPTGFGPICLVSDDRVCLMVEKGCLLARTAPNLEGKLEVRGLGIVAVETHSPVPVCLVVDAVASNEIARMPGENACTVDLLACAIPRLRLDLVEPSAVAKVLTALRMVTKGLAGN